MKIQKTLGAGVMSLGLIMGISSFGLSSFAGATSGTIDTTGPHSNNVIRNRIRNNVSVNNDNHVYLRNYNRQDAYTGNATVRDNTTGGDAMSGEASNDNSFRANLSVDNTGSVAAAVAPLSTGGGGGSALITDTGPHSNNQITSTTSTNVSVRNDNNVSVSNSNDQTAVSGNATVRDNTTGGDAVSGDASNTNSTSVTLSISN